MLKKQKRKPSISHKWLLFILSAIVFLVVIPLLAKKKLERDLGHLDSLFRIDPRYKLLMKYRESNKFIEMTVPHRIQALQSFKPYIQKSNGCINRSHYEIELVKYLGYDIYDDYHEKKPLIIGDQNGITDNLLNVYNNPYHIGCDTYFNFLSDESHIYLNALNISFVVFSCLNPPRKSLHFDAQQNELHEKILNYKAGFSYFQKKQIPFVLIERDFYNDDLFDELKRTGGKSILIPQIIDSNNIFGIAVQECLQYGFSRVEMPRDSVLSEIVPQNIVKLIQSILEKYDNSPSITKISSNTPYNLDSLLKEAVSHIYPCNYSLIMVDSISKTKHDTHSVTFDGKSQLIPKFIRSLRSKKRIPDELPYISFIIPIENNTIESNIIRQLHSFEISKKLYPLSIFEVIYVYSGSKPYQRIIRVPKILKKTVKFMNASSNSQRAKCMASHLKNTGINAARGIFIAVSSPNLLFHHSLFYEISSRTLNPGALYSISSFQSNYSIFSNSDFEAVINKVSESNPDSLRKLILHQNMLHHVDTFELLSKIIDLGWFQHFFIVSKDLYNAIGPFPNFDCSTDDYSIMYFSQYFKLVPGFPVITLSCPSLYISNDDDQLINRSNGIYDSQINDLVCQGYSRRTNYLHNSHNKTIDPENIDQ